LSIAVARGCAENVAMPATSVSGAIGIAGEGRLEAKWLQGVVADGVRVVIDSPAVVDTGRPTRVIFYALPNGSTIEQTIGCKVAAGRDWHFNIQYIGAQTRALREVARGRENIVVVYLEAEGKSWSAWRAARG